MNILILGCFHLELIVPSIPPEYIELGRFIREERRKWKFTQMHVARRVGVSASYICQVEKGATKASDGILHRLESVLELPRGTLFLKILKPLFDLVSTFWEPEPTTVDLLADITSDECKKLIDYLRFLRVYDQIRALSS